MHDSAAGGSLLRALADDEEKWLLFLKYGHELTAEQVSSLGVPETASAEQKLAMISQDKILQMQYEQRLKAERDAYAYAEDKWKAGLEKGKKEGEKRGEKRGKKEGKKEGTAEAILTIVQVRGLPIDESERAAILACQDLDILDRWLKRAVVASSVSDILADR